MNLQRITLVLMAVLLIILSGCKHHEAERSGSRANVITVNTELACDKYPQLGVVDLSQITTTREYEETRQRLAQLELYALELSERLSDQPDKLRSALSKIDLQRAGIMAEFDDKVNGALNAIVAERKLDLLLAEESVAYADPRVKNYTSELITHLSRGDSYPEEHRWYWGFGRVRIGEVRAELLSRGISAEKLDEIISRALERAARHENVFIVLRDEHLPYGGIDLTDEVIRLAQEPETDTREAVDVSRLPVRCIAVVRSEPLLKALGYSERLEEVDRAEQELEAKRRELEESYSKKIDAEMKQVFNEFYQRLKRLRADTDEAIREITSNLKPEELPSDVRKQIESLRRRYQRRVERHRRELEAKVKALRELYSKYHEQLLSQRLKEVTAELQQELYAKERELALKREKRSKEIEELYSRQKLNLQLKMLTAKSKEEAERYQKELMRIKRRQDELMRAYDEKLNEEFKRFMREQRERYERAFKKLNEQIRREVEGALRRAVEREQRRQESVLKKLQDEFNSKVQELLRQVDVTELSGVKERLQSAQKRYEELMQELNEARQKVLSKYRESYNRENREIEEKLRELREQRIELMRAFRRQLRQLITDKKLAKGKLVILIDPLYVSDEVEDITDELLKR